MNSTKQKSTNSWLLSIKTKFKRIIMTLYITKKELQNFFIESYGYNLVDDGNAIYIFSTEKKNFGFIFLRSRKLYFAPWVYFNLWLDRKLLNDSSVRTTWYKLMLHTHINRTIRKQSKNK